MISEQKASKFLGPQPLELVTIKSWKNNRPILQQINKQTVCLCDAYLFEQAGSLTAVSRSRPIWAGPIAASTTGWMVNKKICQLFQCWIIESTFNQC